MSQEQAAAPGDNGSFWCEGRKALLQRLAATPDGLTEAEAQERLRRYGPNLAVTSLRRGPLVKIAKRLVEPLIAILLVAALISGATGDWQSLVIIVLIVLTSIALDVFQETAAENAVDALRRAVAVQVTVFRSGKAREIALREVVPGDIVVLHAGDLAPADGLILESRDAMADEAVLTGEPFPVEKREAPAERSAEGTDAVIFGGTSLVAGEARMLVAATGAETRLGSIARSMQASEPPTAFERGVHGLGMLILRLTGFLVLFVLLTQLARHGLSIESFLFAVALAVGLTPELLPVVMTVTLARGAMRMAERKVVVKRLSAIHDLGAMDVLCTDKTGTLTEARIAHAGSFGCDGAKNPRVTMLASLNSRYCSGIRNNLDMALLAAASEDDGTWLPIADLPFDFVRRRSSVLVAQGEDREMIVKGAPEALLAQCDRLEHADGSVEVLDNAGRARILALMEAKGAEGLRLLGVARRTMPTGTEVLTREDETADSDSDRPLFR